MTYAQEFKRLPTYEYDIPTNSPARSLFSNNLNYAMLSMRFWCPRTQNTIIMLLADVSITKYCNISINGITVSKTRCIQNLTF